MGLYPLNYINSLILSINAFSDLTISSILILSTDKSIPSTINFVLPLSNQLSEWIFEFLGYYLLSPSISKTVISLPFKIILPQKPKQPKRNRVFKSTLYFVFDQKTMLQIFYLFKCFVCSTHLKKPLLINLKISLFGVV